MKTRFPSAPGNRSAAFPLFPTERFLPFLVSLSPRPIVLFLRRIRSKCRQQRRLATFYPYYNAARKSEGRERSDILFEEYDEGITRVPSSPFSSANSSKHRPYHPSLPIITDAYFIRRVIKFVAPRVWPSLNEWRINDDVKLYVAFVVDACIV